MGNSSFSKDVAKLAQADPPVTELNATGKRLTGLPAQVTQLHALKIFNGSNNRIKIITPEIDKLKVSHTILFSQPLFLNRIRHWADRQNLVKLVLSNNNISELPESISNLPSLEELNLSVNKLKELPRGFGAFPKLRILDLSYNGITTVPEQIGLLNHCEELLLSFNEIGVLPASLGRLAELRDLKLSNNYLEDVCPELGQPVALAPRR